MNEKLINKINKSYQEAILEIDAVQDAIDDRKIKLHNLKRKYLGIEHTSQEIKDILIELKDLEAKKHQTLAVLKFINSLQDIMDSDNRP